MSTTIIDIDKTWQNVQAGPQSGISLSAIASRLYYQAVPTSPGATDRGHVLNAADGVGIELTGTDNLWVRTAQDTAAQIALTL